MMEHEIPAQPTLPAVPNLACGDPMTSRIPPSRPELSTTLKCNETLSESLLAPCPLEAHSPQSSLPPPTKPTSLDLGGPPIGIGGVVGGALPFSIANVALKSVATPNSSSRGHVQHSISLNSQPSFASSIASIDSTRVSVPLLSGSAPGLVATSELHLSSASVPHHIASAQSSVSSALNAKGGGPKYTVHLNTSKGQTVVQLPQNPPVNMVKTTIPISGHRPPGGVSNLISSGMSFPTSFPSHHRLYSSVPGGQQPSGPQVSAGNQSSLRHVPLNLPNSYLTHSTAAGTFLRAAGGLGTLAAGMPHHSTLANFQAFGLRGASMLLPVPTPACPSQTAFTNLPGSTASVLKSPGGPPSSGLIYPGSSLAQSPVTPSSSVGVSTPASTPGPSPRPGILRKRPAAEFAAAAGGGSPGATAVRKLVYEPSHLELGRNSNSSASSGNGGAALGQTTSGGETPMATGAEVTISGTRPESPTGRESIASEEASNQSSSSTVSNNSTKELPPTTTSSFSSVPLRPPASLSAELSPRKRPRKQKFDDIVSSHPKSKTPTPGKIAKSNLLPRPKSVLAGGGCNSFASCSRNAGSLTKRPLSSNGREACGESKLNQDGIIIKTEVPDEPLRRVGSADPNRLCNGGTASESRPSSTHTDLSTADSGSTVTDLGVMDEDDEDCSDDESRNSISPVIMCSPVKRYVVRDEKDSSAVNGGQGPFFGTVSSPSSSAGPERPSPEYRPRPSLLSTYDLSWHPRKDHFKRPEAVRFVEKASEKKRRIQSSDTKTAHQTVSRMVNDKETIKRMSPWKIRLIQKQLRGMLAIEWNNFQEVSSWQDKFRKFANIDEHFDFRTDYTGNSQLKGYSVGESRDLEGVHEMGLTMAQRNKAAAEQLDEISGSLGLAVQIHGADLTKLFEKFTSKRPIRSKKFAKGMHS